MTFEPLYYLVKKGVLTVRFNLPYGKKYKELIVDDEHLKSVLISRAHEYKPDKSEAELVHDALAFPINSPPLTELVVGKKNIVIISSDHTRPVPSHIIMPILLAEINASNPQAKITILIATGVHRSSTDNELRIKYGDEIVDNVSIHIHNSMDDEMVDLGQLPSGSQLLVNKIAVEADLLIAEGFIEPHFFAGFSGGRKSILPGIVSYKTVLENHCAEFIASPYAHTGILENNPLHQDMLYAAKAVELAFIINVIINADKEIIKAFAGHREDAHVRGCEFLRQLAKVKRAEADIAIVTNGGYPLDQNIYQSVKGMTSAEVTVNAGGVIIMVTECSDGHGGVAFFDTFKNASSPQEVFDRIIVRSMSETVADQWESQILARILMHNKVIMVTDVSREVIEDMHMIYAQSVKEAIELAKKIVVKKDYKITIIPDGVSVIVEQ